MSWIIKTFIGPNMLGHDFKYQCNSPTLHWLGKKIRKGPKPHRHHLHRYHIRQYRCIKCNSLAYVNNKYFKMNFHMAPKRITCEEQIMNKVLRENYDTRIF